MATDSIQVMTTTDRREVAEEIAREAVSRRLAACVQIVGPIRSIYRWQGAVEEADEWLCLLKTRGELLEELTAFIRGIHPYQVPEIVAVPIVGGNPDYLRWLHDETKPAG